MEEFLDPQIFWDISSQFLQGHHSLYDINLKYLLAWPYRKKKKGIVSKELFIQQQGQMYSICHTYPITEHNWNSWKGLNCDTCVEQNTCQE